MLRRSSTQRSDRLDALSPRPVSSVSAFFPCYDDERTIGSVVGGVVEALAALSIDGEVIVVNDGSRDGSARVLKELAEVEPRLRIVTHEQNRGYGAALRSGFSASSHEWVFYTDGDAQYDPSELALLVEHARHDVDVVQGYKLNRSDNVGRKFIGRLYHRVVALLFGLRVRDTDCDFRLIRRSMFEAIRLEMNSGAICVELVRRLQDAGARFAEVGVHHFPRPHGSSTFFKPKNIVRTLRDLSILWWLLVFLPRLRAYRLAVTVAASGIALFAVTFATSARVPASRSDEAWFLWVAERANSGTALYRGVYFVSTPLAIWSTQLAVWLFGTDVAVERAVASACFAVSLTLIWFVAARVGLGRVGRTLLLATVFVYGSPVAHFGSVYSRLAVAVSLGALLMLLRVLDNIERGCQRALAIATVGALCGAAFDTKPNTGILAFAAVVVSLTFAFRGTRAGTALLRALGYVTAGFLAAIGLMMLPIIMSHSFGPFIGDVFTGKGTAYFAVEGRRLLPGLSDSFAAFTDSTAPLGQLVLRSVPLIPCIGIVLIVIGLGWAWCDRSPARLAIIAFAIVGFVAAAPDLAPQHLTEEMPLLLGLPVVAVACHGATEKRRGPETVRVALVTCAASMLAFGVVSTAIWAHRPVLRPPDRVALSDIPHFGGTMVSASSETRDRADLNELRHDTHGTVFLAVLSAGYYYLAGGLHDPTPYDYPGRSDLGASGESGVVQTLRLRHVRWVCLQHASSTQQNQSPIAPRQLDSYVRHSFRFVEHLNACDLYQSRAHHRRHADGRTRPRLARVRL